MLKLGHTWVQRNNDSKHKMSQLHRFCLEDWTKIQSNHCEKLGEGYLKHLTLVIQVTRNYVTIFDPESGSSLSMQLSHAISAHVLMFPGSNWREEDFKMNMFPITRQILVASWCSLKKPFLSIWNSWNVSFLISTRFLNVSILLVLVYYFIFLIRKIDHSMLAVTSQ